MNLIMIYLSLCIYIYRGAYKHIQLCLKLLAPDLVRVSAFWRWCVCRTTSQRVAFYSIVSLAAVSLVWSLSHFEFFTKSAEVTSLSCVRLYWCVTQCAALSCSLLWAVDLKLGSQTHFRSDLTMDMLPCSFRCCRATLKVAMDKP